MSIEDHRWYDDDICQVITQQDGTILVDLEIDCCVFNKSDSQAIAKHFKQDRESLVSEIEALIATYCKYDDEAQYEYMVTGLKVLINQDKEDV